MFPIVDMKGKIKGFGGRILDDGSPKYMNSPQTYIYNKGSHLYGLNLAWEEIRSQDYAIIVEGYMDLLTPFQHGIKNIVASLGTALTTDQIKLVKRFTNNLIVLFDSDQAGETATLRSLDLIIQEDAKVKVAELPKGFDPDSFIAKYGKESFLKKIKDAQDLFDYKLKLYSSKHNRQKTEGKAKIAGEILPTIAKIKNAIVKSEYMKKLSEALSVDEESLRTELKKIRPDITSYNYRYEIPDNSQKLTAKTTRPAEGILASLMIEDNSMISLVKENLTSNDFKDDSIKNIIDSLFKLHADGKSISPSKLMNIFGTESMCALVSKLMADSEKLMDREKNAEDCIKWIKKNNLKEELNNLRSRIKTAQDSGQHDKVVELVMDYNQLIKKCHEKTQT